VAVDERVKTGTSPNGVSPANGLPQPESGAGIAVSGVWSSYGDRQVLTGLDLSVEQGALIALAGPNGVGKSTLLRLIAGSLRPVRGTVAVMGKDMAGLSVRNKSRLVAVVPQNPELPRGAAALEVVLMGRNPHLGLLAWESAADVEIAVAAMRRTDSEEFLDRPIHQLSGGERQRVAIAMALAQETPVILLDEPTANLDLAYQPMVMRLLQELAASGKTVITALHDLTLAGQFCDSVALMGGGRVLASGAPEEVVTAENIKQVYGADTIVIEHPTTGKPIVVNS
jgi:iron complex transport system ATP-binding protein